MTIDTSYRGWKKEVKSQCRQILYDAELGVSLNDCDQHFLCGVLELHPEADQKFGVGVDYFYVKRNEYGGRTFWLRRTDGSETDFSFMRCVSAAHAMTDFAKACRTAVVQDILAFKNLVFDGVDFVTCPIVGERIFRDTCHIDHAPPYTFDRIVQEFTLLLENPLQEVEETRDGETVTRFRNDEVAEQFREFHNSHASLRAISKYANLSVLRRKGTE